MPLRDGIICAIGLLAAWTAGAQAPLPTRVRAYLDADARAAPALERALLADETADFPALLRAVHAPRPYAAASRFGAIAGRFTVPASAEKTDYRLFIPRGYDPTVATPLWITMHGTGGDASGPFEAMQPHAAKHGFLLASLTEHPSRHGQGWGYRATERDAQLGLIEHVAKRYHVDRNRIYVNGWSRGGHASWDLALRHPDRIAGAGPIIGAVRLRDLPLVANVACRLDVVNGAKDQPELVDGARQAITRLKKISAAYRHFLDPDRGHEFFGERVAPMVDYLLEARRDPAPARVRLHSYEIEYAQSFWVRIDEFARDRFRAGEPLRVMASPTMDLNARRLAYARSIDRRVPSVDARRRGNTITAKTNRVVGLTIGIPPGSIDFAKPVRIVVNSRTVFRGKVTRSRRLLLRTARETGDPELAWANAIRVDRKLRNGVVLDGPPSAK